MNQRAFTFELDLAKIWGVFADLPNGLVSVLPCLAKVLERFANQQFQDCAVENKLISEKQFAYQKRSSCNTALIRLVDERKWSIDIKQIPVAVAAFLDLRKAFDTCYKS